MRQFAFSKYYANYGIYLFKKQEYNDYYFYNIQMKKTFLSVGKNLLIAYKVYF